MRKSLMGKLIQEVDDGTAELSPELEAEAEVDARLAEELASLVRKRALLPFLAAHPDSGSEVVGTALLQLAALHVMAELEMGPDDFADLAHRVAELFRGQAQAIRKEVTSGSPRAKAAVATAAAMQEETRVQVQVRLVLEQQCRAIADKLKGMCPAGVGFALFLADYGEKGNTAYVSSVSREDMINLVEEWLARQEGE